jgi:hypothetical protein
LLSFLRQDNAQSEVRLFSRINRHIVVQALTIFKKQQILTGPTNIT